MIFPFALVTALVISMAIIPLMMRLAPSLGMVDMPDPRKVHVRPVPRVGGLGIVIGAVVSILMWMPMQGWLPSFLVGSLVLLVFGALDDSMELGHYVKFIGQFAAAIGVVYWGDLWVRHFPFVSGELDPAFGKPFAVMAIVGMINAINHSDGLDGLAGGESLMSLGCLAYLGYLGGGFDLVIVVGAVIGGVFGFLRYNTHPARVFMGDAGSQFLGFALAVLAVHLTQQVNPGLSMAIPALILGLPIVDILAVLGQRIYQGMNWFRATRNHVHHRLLELGYAHYQAVVIIYSIQALFVVSAILVRYESDFLVLGIYVSGCALVFLMLWLAERRNWRVGRTVADVVSPESGGLRAIGVRIAGFAQLFVLASLPAYLLLAGMFSGGVSRDCGVAAFVIAPTVAAGWLLLRAGSTLAPTVIRLGLFSAASLIVYLVESDPEASGSTYPLIRAGYFVLLALATGIAIRVAREAEFRTTPLDYLLVGLVIAGGLLAKDQLPGIDIGAVIVQMVVLFYACEWVINRGSRAWIGALSACALTATLVVLSKAAIF
ncbi:MAG: glycosyltransferase family 4 protein [Burkholderiales bacterium]